MALVGEMKIRINEQGNFVFEEVFSPILFETDDGQRMGIQMRDGGFEISLLNHKKNKIKWYRIQGDAVDPL